MYEHGLGRASVAALLAVAAVLTPAAAQAGNCSTAQYPYLLQNNAVADASQVMADLNCAPIVGLATWPGNVGIGTTAPNNVLTIAGSGGAGGGPAILGLSATSTGPGLLWASSALASNLTAGGGVIHLFGEGLSAYNSGYIGLRYAGSGSAANYITLGIYGHDDLLVVNGSGYVGIFTPTPAYPLDVGGNTRVLGQIEISGGQSTGWPLLGFNALYNGNASGGWINSFTGYSGAVQLTQDNGRLAFSTSGLSQSAGAGFSMSERFTILSNGNVGVNNTAPSATFYVNGSTVLTQGYQTTSDERLKTDITPVTHALEIIERLQAVRYRWRPPEARPVGKTLQLPTDTPQIGFLAQAVAKAAPEAVSVPRTSDEVYTLDPSKLIPLLVTAMQEQQAKISRLEAQVQALTAASRGGAK